MALRACRPAGIGASRAFHAALALCLGVGASALTTFWIVAAGGQLDRTYVLVDLALWVGVCGLSLAWIRWRSEASATPEPTRNAPFIPMPWWVKASFISVAVLSIATVTRGYLSAPHGDWDAWAMWNQKARFLLRAGEGWMDALTIGWSQPGHPLLVPTAVARLWAYAGEETTVAPALIGVLFGAAAVSLVVATLGPQRPRAWVAGAVLLAPGMFLREWTAQQADIPFACFMVATLAALALAQMSSASAARPLLLISGGLAGLAAWTKNEGIVLVCVTFVLATILTLKRNRLRDALWWTAGTIPPLVTLAWFKIAVAPDGPYYLPDAPLSSLLLERVFASNHHVAVNAALWERLAAWGAPMVPGAMFAAVAAAIGIAIAGRGTPTRTVIAPVVTMLAAYYAVYLITWQDVTWLVATTFDRLLVQLWPSAVLAVFLVDLPDSESPWRVP